MMEFLPHAWYQAVSSATYKRLTITPIDYQELKQIGESSKTTDAGKG
jgi:hypothetical protein